jgi:carbamoyltransferase
MSVILGLNGIPFLGHDPAAALIIDGVVVAAVEEERLTRTKRAMGCPPTQAVREVMSIAGLSPHMVDVVAVPWMPKAMGYANAWAEAELRAWLEAHEFRRGSSLQIRFVEHHEAHAWSGLAFVPKGLENRNIGVLVADGSGESTGGAAYLYGDRGLTRHWHLKQASSLGLYYESVTQYLGFVWGEEGKTMGLAAYGRDMDLLMPDLCDAREHGPLLDWPPEEGSTKHRHERFREALVEQFQRLHGNPSHLTFNARADIALAAQAVVAERLMTYVREFSHPIDVVVFAGGVALNCTINATLAAYCRARGIEFVIPPPASDTGVALGAAVAALENPLTLRPIDHPFLGAHFSADTIVSALQSHGTNVELMPIERIATLLVEQSLVCGWVEGRSEIGPRALGARAIVARPDSVAVRDRINFLKGRESWRPLAPSVTAAEFQRSFPQAIPSPHMLINAASRGASHLRGVIHVDGTSRPQVVDRPGPYRDLLTAIGHNSDGEALVCTSFNAAGEPIVYSPTDALRSARVMHLDALAGDGWFARL